MFAKGRVESLDESRVDVSQSLRLFDHERDGGFRALVNLPCDADHAVRFILLDHLSDEDLRPFHQARTTCGFGHLWLAKDLDHCSRITH